MKGGLVRTVASADIVELEKVSQEGAHGDSIPQHLLKRAVLIKVGWVRIMPDLSVAVDGNSIIVAQPNSGLCVTYRRDGRVLVARNPMRNPNSDELKFLVESWKAVHAKAQSLGWF